MIPFEFAITLASFAFTLAGIASVIYIVRTSGADRAPNPQRVAQLVRKAPYHRIDTVLTKRR